MKRFNYTGRKKILQADIHVQLKYNEGQQPYFNIVIDIADYGLPTEASVVVEAHQGTRWMRFNMGQVGLIKNTEKQELTDFDDIEHLSLPHGGPSF